MLTSYSFSLISALLWAISAPILNYGIQRIPKNARISGILIGLLVSLVTGSALLLIITFPNLKSIALSPYVILAGIFTFPIATGFYYLCSSAFDGKAEIAAQFARVKPIFSVLLAVLILREQLSYSSYTSLLLISIGIVFLINGRLHGVFSSSALVLGMLTALSWAIGEVFMTMGLTTRTSIEDTCLALLSGTIACLILFIPLFPSLSKQKLEINSWIIPFIAHGILSFGLAYSAFFESIKQIGMGQTVLINAFWPILAILLTCFISRLKAEEHKIPKYVWYATPFLLIGSILQLIKLS